MSFQIPKLDSFKKQLAPLTRERERERQPLSRACFRVLPKISNEAPRIRAQTQTHCLSPTLSPRTTTVPFSQSPSPRFQRPRFLPKRLGFPRSPRIPRNVAGSGSRRAALRRIAAPLGIFRGFRGGSVF
ncbi:hypothetical protein VNO78_27378 [Psophocarpus tetragonolobus]|uniref:Uncharacterized protein n=1 Tax=Psophocarpus tetragonolobus TaxID=3891 RepID=A0AAN9S3F1_PSOTE